MILLQNLQAVNHTVTVLRSYRHYFSRLDNSYIIRNHFYLAVLHTFLEVIDVEEEKEGA